MKKMTMLAMMIAALPLAALAQAQQQGGGPGPYAQDGAGPRRTPEQMLKRMRLARTLGLAEALELDSAQALKLSENIARFDDRRIGALKQAREAVQVLRRAAQGEKLSAAEVDQAIGRALDARAQLQAVDRDTVAAVTKDLSPDKKARAVLFLAKFQRRFAGREMHGGHGMGGMGPGGGRGGPGFQRGGGQGMMGPGAGQGGMMGMGPPGSPGADWDEDADE